MDDKKSRGSVDPCAVVEWDERRNKDVLSRPAVNCERIACKYCAWNPAEMARRAKIPLTMCSDGLRRKIIPLRPGQKVGDDETEAESDE